MKRVIAGLAVLALLAVGAVAYVLRPKQLLFDVRTSLDAGVAGKVAILSDAREVGVFGPGPIRFQIPGRSARRYSQQMLPEFKGRALYPCGFKDIAVFTTKPSDAELAKAGSRGVPLPLSLSISQPSESDRRVAILWVDNLDRPEARLAVGQDERTIAAGAKQELHFLVEDCAEGRGVSLDGRAIGELPADIKPATAGSVSVSIDSGSEGVLPGDDFLVDTSGKQCYRLGEQYYGRSSNAGYGYAPAYSTTLRRAAFRRLPPMEVHFFLEKAPQRLEIQVSAGMADMLQSKNYIHRVTCDGSEE